MEIWVIDVFADGNEEVLVKRVAIKSRTFDEAIQKVTEVMGDEGVLAVPKIAGQGIDALPENVVLYGDNWKSVDDK